MRILNYIIRWTVAFLVTVAYNAALVFPTLFLVWVCILPLQVLCPGWSRNLLCRLMCGFGYGLWGLLMPILGIRFEFDADGVPPASGAAIVLSNHVSVLDILILFWILHRLRRPFPRWIMKRELWWTPFAAAARAGGGILVRRDGDPADRAKVAACGIMARQDGGDVVLFPEGTRFMGPSDDGAWRHLRAPKLGGFSILREKMPDAPVISVTMRWTGGRGRTAFDASGLVGLTIRISARLIPAEAVAADPEWLKSHWREKDAELATPSV